MEAQLDALVPGREGILELVAIAVPGRRGKDRLEGRVLRTADSNEGVAHLLRLLRELRLVCEVLEATATAGPKVPAGRFHSIGPRVEQLAREALGEAPLDLCHTRANSIAWESTPDEDDEAAMPRNAVAAVRERLDRELELLPLVDRRTHAGSVAVSSSGLPL